MPGTVKRNINSRAVEEVYFIGDNIINFSKNPDLKIIVSNFIDSIKANIANAATTEYQKKKQKDLDGNDIIIDGEIQYVLDDKGQEVNDLDDNGNPIPKMRPDGMVSRVVPMVLSHELSIDGMNAYWLLLKDFVKDKMAKSSDIERARVICIILGMTKRWISITADVKVDTTGESPIDGEEDITEVSVPLD